MLLPPAQSVQRTLILLSSADTTPNYLTPGKSMFTIFVYNLYYRRDEGKQCKAEDADLLRKKGLCSKFGLSIEEDTDVPFIKDSKPPEATPVRTGEGCRAMEM